MSLVSFGGPGMCVHNYTYMYIHTCSLQACCLPSPREAKVCSPCALLHSGAGGATLLAPWP